MLDSVAQSPGAGLFELNEDHRAIQEMAEGFAAEKIAPFAIEWDENKHFPVDVLRGAAELGMASIYVREQSGGSGLTRLDAALIFEALATGCPTVSAFLSIHNMVAWMVDTFGNEVQHEEFLSKLVSMDWIASYCLTEPGSGSDAAALKTSAIRDGDDYIINGAKQFISGAGVSDVYLTMVRTSDDGPKGVSAVLIPKDAAGVSFGANEKKMGWNAQPTATVNFDNVRIPVTNRLGPEGDGFKYAMAGLDGGRLNIAACSLGGAQDALNKALSYTAERKAFGQSLDQFQALQFRLADMGTELEVARTFLYRAAAALDRKEQNATKLCAMAKKHVTDTCSDIANQALQLHGGYGYLADYGVEKIVRDLRVHQILEGTNEIMRLIISRAMLKERDNG